MQAETSCPFCGLDVVDYVASRAPEAIDGIQLQCDNCGARGPVGNDNAEALSLWNKHGGNGVRPLL